MTTRKSKRGGVRKGAGRKPSGLPPKERKLIAVSPSSAERLSIWAAAHDVTLFAAADIAIAHLTQD